MPAWQDQQERGVFLPRAPSDQQVQTFLAAQQLLPFSYPEVGASRAAGAPGYAITRCRLQLGAGAATFARACAALQRWAMFELRWTRLCWPATPPVAGSTVAVVARHFGFWSLNACRVVYVVEEQGAIQRYGFAFGTLPGHAERGEERFTVEWHAGDNSVWYELYSFARPNHWLVLLGYPLMRLTQRRFARQSAAAVRAAVQQPS